MDIFLTDLDWAWTTIVLVAVALAVALGAALTLRRLFAKPRPSGGRRARLAILAGIEALALTLSIVAVVLPNTPMTAVALPPGNSAAHAIQPDKNVKIGPHGQFPRNSSTSKGIVYSTVVTKPASLHVPATVTDIYVPPGYDPAHHSYPVLYLFPGNPGLGRDWFGPIGMPKTMDRLIASKKIPPMILVGADQVADGTKDSECLNQAGNGGLVETAFVKVLVPWTDAHFATLKKPTGRAIGGFSSGAFCAVDQTLRHPKMFGSFMAFAAFDSPELPKSAIGDRYPSLATVTPRDYIPTMTFMHPVSSYLAVGTGNRDRRDIAQTEWLAKALRGRGQKVSLDLVPGFGHSWKFVEHQLSTGLIFLGKHLR